MKLDIPGTRTLQPLAPSDWTMELEKDGLQYVAQLMRGNVPICRLSIAAEGQTEAQARTELADKARAWIADYLSRPHSGDTQFGSL